MYLVSVIDLGTQNVDRNRALHVPPKIIIGIKTFMN